MRPNNKKITKKNSERKKTFKPFKMVGNMNKMNTKIDKTRELWKNFKKI